MTTRPLNASEHPLSLAVLVGNAAIPTWQSDFLASLDPDVAMTSLVVIDENAQSSGWPDLKSLGFFARLLEKRSGKAIRRVPVAEGISPATRIENVRLGDDAGWQYKNLPEINDLDLVVDFRTQVGAEIELDSRLGVWSPYVRWENNQRSWWKGLIHGSPPVVAIKVHAGRDRGPNSVISQGWVHAVPWSVSTTLDTIFSAMTTLMTSCITKAQGSMTLAPVAASANDSSTRIQLPAVVPFFAGSIFHKIRWLISRLARQDQWHVGVVDSSIEEVYTKGVVDNPTWYSNPNGQYLADPFGLPDRDEILVEAFDATSQKGRIVALRRTNGELSAAPVFHGAGHMSYPYLFQSDGDVFCVPETSDQQTAILYRCSAWPHKWTAHATIVDNLAATDSTIFQHEGSWWMLCTDDQAGSGSHLYAFYAPSLDGPWIPHILNPVKVDVRSARPAGTPFRAAGRLIRPAQSHDRGYGSGIVFNEVIALSETAFEERVVGTLSPPRRGPFRHGLHTISALGSLTLIDGKRRRFALASMMGATRKRLRSQREGQRS